MKITMIGTGYVGLVSGTCFADIGHDVICVDKNEDKITSLKNGQIPIYEPGLDELVKKNVAAGRLSFTTDISECLAGSDAVFIGVGTPTAADGTSADLSYVLGAAKEIAKNMTNYMVVVTKSTVPVGTNAKVKETIQAANPEADFDIASNPEFLREGNAIEDFLKPDRIVIGTENDRARDVMAKFYAPLTDLGYPLLFTSPQSAELIKYASNAFLATKISFINQMADLCEQTGANIDHIANGIGLDKRISPMFLRAGPGYGGSCFPKDTRALSKTGHDFNTPVTIVDNVIIANKERKENMAKRILKALGDDATHKKIGILGVAFKPNTDDMRDSPSLDILPQLVKSGAKVHAYDPAAMLEAKHLLSDHDITWEDNKDAVIKDADCLVLLTEWDEFLDIDLATLSTSLKQPIFIDLRNGYDQSDFTELGFDYYSIGRTPILNYSKK